ncbi:MAG: 4Fe-4S dicluster domain-containing protein [Clostridia bacterium]|nr:4Fe-4S dicluster domain-containing protein [Clostridia bacterium]
MMKNFYSVTLDPEKCKGCINCMKHCPTEAIRVRGGKAQILYDRCIGCGECIRACSHHAKKVNYDPFSIIDGYEYKIALPPPSLYGQFQNLTNINYVLQGLLDLGFDDVFEVSCGAELASQVTRMYIDHAHNLPVISSACPAVVELILMRFHNLKDHLLPILAPVEIAAKLAREAAVKKTGLAPEKIGIFFISPCPAKIFTLKTGLGSTSSKVDGVLAQSDVYFRLVEKMNAIKTEPDERMTSGLLGVGWASSGGEAAGVLKEKYLAADGIENCISVLEALENNTLTDVDFVELNACPGGCVGGVLNVENPFIARAKIKKLRKYMPVTRSRIEDFGRDLSYFAWEKDPETMPVFRLDADFGKALMKMQQVEDIYAQLPKLDCGLCGAPSCRSFAEDVVSGRLPEGAVCPRLKEE